MKVFGSISRLVALLFRKDANDITLRPNQATTYTAARDIQLPPGDTAHVLVSASSTATFTNKTFDADGTGNSISNIENADIKAGAAIDASKIADGSVSSTEFQYLSNVTSDIQTQFAAKVTGPASATDEALARFDGTTGKLIQNSLGTLTDAGALSGLTQANVDNLRLDGNALSSTDTNGDLQLDPNGTGAVSVRDNAELRLADADNSAYIGLKSAAVVAASLTYTLPEAPAVSGYVLASTTGGVMSWISNAATNSFTADWITADGTSKVVTHSLASSDVLVTLYDKLDNATIYIDSEVRTDANTVTLTASEAPNASGWRVIVSKLA